MAWLLTLLLMKLAYPGGMTCDVTEAEFAGVIAGTSLGTLRVCGLLAANYLLTIFYWEAICGK